MGAAIAWLQSALGDKKAFVLLLQLGSTFYAAHLFQFPAPVPRAPPSFHAAALCSGCQQGLSHPHHRQTLFRCCHFSLEASQRIRNVILALRCTISQILKSFGWTLPLFRPIKARRGHTGRPCFPTVCLTFFFFLPAPLVHHGTDPCLKPGGNVWANEFFVLCLRIFPSLIVTACPRWPLIDSLWLCSLLRHTQDCFLHFSFHLFFFLQWIKQTLMMKQLFEGVTGN